MRHLYCICTLFTTMVLVAACAIGTTPADRFPADGGAGGGEAGSGGAGGDACGPVSETRFPAQGLGDAVVLCTQCNSTCPVNAEACDVYGVARLSDIGTAEICAACCSAGKGALIWRTQ